jgi:hypothetical protein
MNDTEIARVLGIGDINPAEWQWMQEKVARLVSGHIAEGDKCLVTVSGPRKLPCTLRAGKAAHVGMPVAVPFMGGEQLLVQSVFHHIARDTVFVSLSAACARLARQNVKSVDLNFVEACAILEGFDAWVAKIIEQTPGAADRITGREEMRRLEEAAEQREREYEATRPALWGTW